MAAGILSGVGAATLATWAGFQCYWPTSQVWGRAFVGLPRGSRTLALTYDDGPNDPWTLRLIEVLARDGVKASFFVIGRFVQQKPEIARAIAAEGHVLGIHTWDHPNLLFANGAEVRSQIERTRQVIVDTTGFQPTLMRPPFGARRPATLSIIRERGLEPVMWSVTCYDWKPTTPERILAHVKRQVRGGDIILLHDGGYLKMGADRSHSVEASVRLIRQYKDDGYQFATVPQMIAASRQQMPSGR